MDDYKVIDTDLLAAFRAWDRLGPGVLDFLCGFRLHGCIICIFHDAILRLYYWQLHLRWQDKNQMTSILGIHLVLFMIGGLVALQGSWWMRARRLSEPAWPGGAR